MKSWYLIHPEPRIKISKPVLYCVSDNGCFRDDSVAVALCTRADLRDLRVAMSIRHEYQ